MVITYIFGQDVQTSEDWVDLFVTADDNAVSEDCCRISNKLIYKQCLLDKRNPKSACLY